MRGLNASTIILSLLAIGTFVFKVIFNVLAGLGEGPFPRSVANVSDIYVLDITPAGWAFSIWALIYTWNLAYVVYALTTECRDVPPVLDGLYYVLYIVSDLVNVAWLYAFTRETIVKSCVVLLANQLALYALLYVVYAYYIAYKKELEKQHPADAICLAVLVQNGIMLNAAWVTIASLLNICMVLTYHSNVPEPTACVLSLAALLVIALVWFTLQNFAFQAALNYTYSDWPVVLWALSAILAKNWDPQNISAQFSLALLIIVAILLIVRIVLQVLKNKKTASYYSDQELLNENHFSL